MERKDWIIIGISGVTCAGKTTLTNRLLNALTPIYAFNQDTYFYPDDSPKHVKVEGMEHNNYDILSSVDMEQMYADLKSTICGADKSTSRHLSCSSGALTVPGKKFLVMEGITILNDRRMFQLCDYKYYLTLEYGECASRRALRVYSPPDVAGYFERCVWPHHLRYRAEMESEPSVRFLSGADPDIFDVVLQDLKKIGLKEITN